jgi:hypothetical protein
LTGVVYFHHGTEGIRTLFVRCVTLLYFTLFAVRFAVHHTIAWRLSLADITETDVTPVPDSIMSIQNGHFTPQDDWFIQAAYYGALGPTRARIVTPTLRQITTPFIADYRANPLRLKGLEEIQYLAFQTSGGAAVVAGVAFISKTAIQPMPQGDVFTMRGTGATTAVAGAWTQATITWQDTLPQGVFAVVGCGFIGATCIAGRLIFEDAVYRPGALGTSTALLNQSPIFLKGGLGEWGRFNSNRMPNVELLCNAADVAQEIYLDIIRVR